MKPVLKLILVTLPIVLIGVGGLVYTVSNSPPPEQIPLAERATAVRVITARKQPVVPQVTGFGLVSPARTYDLIPQVQGIADYVNPALQKGAILPAGTLLLRLSPTDFNLEIAQARANIRSAEARLAEQSISEQNLISALAIEQEALALSQREYERIENLSTTGAVSAAALDTIRAKFLAQRQKVLNVESSIALLPTQRAVQAEQIAVYQASLDIAKLKLKRTEITLPFTARVSSSSLEVGQYVSAFVRAAEFDGTDAAEIDAQVSVDDMLRLLALSAGPGKPEPTKQNITIDPSVLTDVLRKLGLTATVRLQIGEGVVEWPATVDRISDTIDQKAGTIGVIVRVDNAYSGAQPGLRPPLTKGMFVEVTLSARPIDGVVIPRSALRNGQVMLVDADSRLQLHTVKPLFVQAEIALITEGLAPDSQVLVSTPIPMMTGVLLDVTQDTELMDQLAKTGSAE